MDTNILGLLMIGNWTIYEMRKMIETNFTSISSSSLGSMQTAIKKLLEMECITFSEHVENGVNKKVYSITTAGKRKFFSNISAPMKYKEKNMELNQVFLFGFFRKRGSDNITGFLHQRTISGTCHVAENTRERRRQHPIRRRISGYAAAVRG